MADTLKPLPKFVKTTYAKYVALATKASDTLYFITDSTQTQIYLGEVPYTSPFIVIGAEGELPSVAATGVNAPVKGAFYFKQSDNTAYFFDGTAYRGIAVATTGTISGSLAAEDGTVPTTYAVEQYVKGVSSTLDSGKVSAFGGTANHIVAVGTTDANNATIKDSGLIAGGATFAATPLSTTLATEKGAKTYADGIYTKVGSNYIPKFNGTVNHLVTVSATAASAVVKDSGLVAGGATLAGTPVSTTLATEAAVKAYADGIGTAASNYASTLVANLGTVFNYKGTKADMAALNAVTGMVAGDVWNVTAGANGSSAEYVYNGTAWEELGTTIDLSGYATKVATSAKDQVLIADANGNVSASGKKIGGATLAASPNSTTLATEAAVKAYADGVASAAAGAYIPFVADGVNDDIAILANGGSAIADSGKKLGGAALAATPDSVTMATELAVKAYADSVAAAAQSACVAKFGGTANHIVTISATNTTSAVVKDSGFVAGGATFAATPVSTTLATEKGVSAFVASKYIPQLTSAATHTDKVVFFADGGKAVQDKSYTVDTTSFAATPSSTTLATEAAAAAYVTAALQEMAWTEL